MRFAPAATLLALTLLFPPGARTQTPRLSPDPRDWVMCSVDYLWSPQKDCGKPTWYPYIFVGSVTSMTLIEGDQYEMQVAPEEVFAGSPGIPFKVIASQNSCLPKISVGDRWLFYLSREKDKPVTLQFGGDSAPAANSEVAINTLRQLEKIGDRALLRGEVIKGDPFASGNTPLPSAVVTATLQSPEKTFVASTGPDGRFQFEPLPMGEYKITVAASGSYQPDENAAALKPGTCTDLTLGRSPHASVSGHVRHLDGSPAPDVDIVLINADNSGYDLSQTNSDGLYTFSSLRPGKFALGLIYPRRKGWTVSSAAGANVALPPVSVFFPGVPLRTDASTISLNTDEESDDLDFLIANESPNPPATTPPNVR